MAKTEIEKLDDLASFLDSHYRVPGTNIRFGWDALLGLVPGIGDIAAFGPSAFLVYKAHKLGARKRVVSQMAINSGVDFVLGGIPVLGDLFDLAFKANNRNIDLLKRELSRREAVDA